MSGLTELRMGLWARSRLRYSLSSCFHFRFMLFCFGWCLKRKLNGLVCLSVFAWLLCPCCLSVRLCSLVFLCLAVFRCYCSAFVWAAGCVAARLVAAVQVFWGSLLCFLPASSCPRGLRWLVSLQVSPGSFHVMTCFGYTQAQPCFRGLGVRVDLLKRSKTCT